MWCGVVCVWYGVCDVCACHVCVCVCGVVWCGLSCGVVLTKAKWVGGVKTD